MRDDRHPVPAFRVVDREQFIVERCAEKSVLDIGASGLLHNNLVAVASHCRGLDRNASYDIHPIDLDRLGDWLPVYDDVQIVVCGETLEHLSNPGRFLDALRLSYKCPAIFTVPNAFADVSRNSLERGIETVNEEHVAYYSWWTLTNLLKRHGFEIAEFYWWGRNSARPKFSEGLLCVTG